MCRLAALRPRVDFMVLALPERHGGLPGAWLGPVRELVAADFGVLVTASLGTARHLADEHGISVVELGNAGTAPEPEKPLPDAAYPPDTEQLAPTAPRAGAQETS